MNWYYKNEAGNDMGPVSEATLKELGAVGAISSKTQIRAEGTDQWIALENFPTPQQITTPPAISSPPPIPANPTDSNSSDIGDVLMAHAKRIFPLLGVLAKRAFSSDFNGKMTSPEEDRNLETLTSDKTLKNYLSWRRAVVVWGAILLAIAFLFGLPNFFNSFDSSGGSSTKLPAFKHFSNIILQIALVLAIYLLVKSHFSWLTLKRSRKQAWLAGAALFVVPFVVYLIPVRWFMSDTVSTAYGDEATTAVSLGIEYSFALIPVVISIFPAFLRSSLVMKAVMPESTLPGWIALMIAPFNTLFFLIGLVLVMQIGNYSGIMTFAALSLAPVFILMHVKKLIRPNTPEIAAKVIKKIRVGLFVCYIIALIGVTWMLSSMIEDNVTLIISTVCSFFAKILIFNVVISDYLLGLIRFSYSEEEHLRDSELVETLSSRINSTAQLG